MKRYKITYAPKTRITVAVVEAETEEEAYDNFNEGINVISKADMSYDEGFLEIEERE